MVREGGKGTYLANGLFFQFDAAEHVVAIVLFVVEGIDQDAIGVNELVTIIQSFID